MCVAKGKASLSRATCGWWRYVCWAPTGTRGCCSPIGRCRTRKVRCASLPCIESVRSVEDSFKFLKTCLGWEDVQVLDWQGIRTLVAFGCVAAGFLFDLGVTFDWVEVQLLAKLGGWEPHKDRMPGKITLLRGLGRLF